MTDLLVALEETPLTGPGNKYRRKLLSKTIAHFERNRLRMRYQRLRRHDLDIATGVVEGAVRHLVINDQWHHLAEYLADDHDFRLPSQPTPAQPYDATPKVAA